MRSACTRRSFSHFCQLCQAIISCPRDFELLSKVSGTALHLRLAAPLRWGVRAQAASAAQSTKKFGEKLGEWLSETKKRANLTG